MLATTSPGFLTTLGAAGLATGFGGAFTGGVAFLVTFFLDNDETETSSPLTVLFISIVGGPTTTTGGTTVTGTVCLTDVFIYASLASYSSYLSSSLIDSLA